MLSHSGTNSQLVVLVEANTKEDKTLVGIRFDTSILVLIEADRIYDYIH